jgi:hypothetical protein
MKATNAGFVKKILLIIAALVLLKYLFDFNILEFLKSPKVAAIIEWFGDFFGYIWRQYLSPVLGWLIDLISEFFRK